MNSPFLWEKLEDSEEFKKFKKENKDAYLCSGFFMIDLENKNPENKYHFDFYVPSSKKTFSFELEQGIKLVELERFEEKWVLLKKEPNLVENLKKGETDSLEKEELNRMEKVLMKDNFDFEEITEMILEGMAEKKINNKILKMIFSLQNQDGKDILFGTILLSGLGLLKMTFDISEKKVTDLEKKSFFDMMKIVKK